MAIFVTDSSEGSTISSNPDGESVSAIKPRSERLKMLVPSQTSFRKWGWFGGSYEAAISSEEKTQKGVWW